MPTGPGESGGPHRTRSRGPSKQGRAPSMADVAQSIGVSHQTVSRVLNGSPLVRDDTRDRVLAAIEELGYHRNNAARALVTNRSGRIGVIAAHLVERGPAMIASALQDAALAASYEVSLVGVHDVGGDSLRAAVDRLMEQSVEAIVVAVTHREAVARAAGLEVGIPIVLVEGVLGGGPSGVAVNQRQGGVLATEHLLALGHDRVAHVAGPEEWVEATERELGWRDAHAALDREPGPRWVGDWTAASGYAAGHLVADASDVTAVFVGNDQMALGLLLALRERGLRVPEDVSVVGFDDLPETAYFSPPLTTIRQDFAELGRRAVDLVVRALRGESAPRTPGVVPVLVERGSTTRRG